MYSGGVPRPLRPKCHTSVSSRCGCQARAKVADVVTAFDHLGNTAKRIALEFKTDGSVLSLLTLLDSAQRPRVLELVDDGQRARVEAEWLGEGKRGLTLT